jgi:hypothetical protein
MAANTVEEVRVLKRGGGAAATFAFIAMVLSIISLILALRASQHANTANANAKSAIVKSSDLKTKVDNALGALNKATPGGGVGENSPQPVIGTNSLPNANGQ